MIISWLRQNIESLGSLLTKKVPPRCARPSRIEAPPYKKYAKAQGTKLQPPNPWQVSDITEGLTRSVVTIKESEPAINAFNTMTTKNVSGLAVVDNEGTLVGNISVRDLRGVGSPPAHTPTSLPPLHFLKCPPLLLTL